jgi:4-amino-4-deoxy-L-arabinose transferase-like glycosyltransferase
VIDAGDGMTRGRFLTGLVAVLVLAAALRSIYPAADPPWQTTVGVVWHDEGAWVHNARNRALFGAWSLDNWNPLYIAPVFTGLEYLSFEAFGVGVRQARLVPEAAGLASVLLLALGIGRLGGRHASLAGGALLATSYVYVMWNRAALMEGPMVAFMVLAWYGYVRAQTAPRWGWLAGIAALLAFFTKASAAFFVVAVGLDAVMTLVLVRLKPDATEPFPVVSGFSRTESAALATLGGLVVGGVLALAVFVLPNWHEYLFYNVQMSITRKPSYDVRSLLDRVTNLPIYHDIFTRSWFVLALGTAAALGTLSRWTRIPAGERLLVLWVGLGAFELMLHDVGNERRFIFFIPPLVALASLALGRDRTILPQESAAVTRRRALFALPIVLYASYVVAGAIVRIGFLYLVSPNVRLAAAAALALTTMIYATWPRIPRWLTAPRWSANAGLAVALLVAMGQTVQFGQWAAGHTYKNYEASQLIGRSLPPGTLVHGKLANGLALENRIKPIFVGREFGNYDDRRRRDDVRYILTYIAPSVGYESQRKNPVIDDVLQAYPDRRIILTFDVAETATGHDQAALIDKFGGAPPGNPVKH